MYNLVSFVLSFIKNWYARLSLCKNSGALQWDDTAPVGRAPPQGDTPERKHDTMWIVRYIKLSVARGYIPRIKDFWLGSTWSCSCTEKNETNKRCGRDARLRWSEGETQRKEVGEDETKRSKKVFSSFVEAHLPYLHRPLSSYFFFFHFISFSYSSLLSFLPRIISFYLSQRFFYSVSYLRGRFLYAHPVEIFWSWNRARRLLLKV